MNAATNAADAARQELGAAFAGQLLGPSDPGYDAARAVYNAMIDHRPALIARCASSADVAAAITFARRHDVLLADATHPYSAGGAYVNFVMDEGDERVRATYGENYDRLAAAKATYDPTKTFRVNQNIAPSSRA